MPTYVATRPLSLRRRSLGPGDTISSTVLSEAELNELVADGALIDQVAFDAVVAALAGTSGTATRTALAGTYATVVVLPPASGGDDTAAAQAVISAAAAGQTVRATPGQAYSVTTLTIPAGVRLDMTGCTITQAAATSGDLVTMSGAGASLVGGTWDGNHANQSTSNKGITITAADCTLDGITVQNTKQAGIYGFGAARLRIRNVRTSGTRYIGIFVRTNGVSIDGPIITGCIVDRSGEDPSTISEGGLKVRGESAAVRIDRTQIDDCRVTMPVSPTDGTAVCVETTYAYRSSVRGCTTAGGSMGVSIAACDYTAVSGCTVYDAGSYGIESAGSRYASIVNNIIDGNGNTNQGITLTQGGGNNSDSNTITGNVVSGCDGSALKTQAAIRLTVTGNTFIQTISGYVCQLQSATDSVFAGNTVDGTGVATKGLMLDSCARVAVSGNAFRSLTQHGVLLYTAIAFTITEVTVTGNMFSSTGTAVGSQVSGGGSLSAFCKVIGNIGRDDRYDLANDVLQGTGTGTPEGVVSAGRGSLFMRRDGGAGAVFYVKESASGNTGWVAK